MKKQLLVVAVLSALAATAVPAQAGVLDDGALTISGFGTLGVAKSNTDDAQFARYNQAEGIGDKARIGLDTNLGLQATYKMNDWLSGTVQVLTRKTTSDSYSTDLTWGFLKARVNDEVSVRVGRIVMPIFLISDYQNVGYANTMMRPPIEMYGQEPMENADGVDVNWQRAFGEVNFTGQAFVGRSRGKLFVPTGAGSVANYRAPAAGVSLSGEYGPFTVRVGHARADLKIKDLAPINTLGATLQRVGFSQLASDLNLTDGKKIAFTSIGATMDWNNIVVQTEYAQRRAKDPVYIPDTNSWYFMTGYRIGKVLPYYSHASTKDAGSSVDLPANFPRAGVLSSTVRNTIMSAGQTSDLIGVRWDFAKSLALKVQVDHVKPKTKSGMLIFAPAAGYRNSVTVVGASLDFVF